MKVDRSHAELLRSVEVADLMRIGTTTLFRLRNERSPEGQRLRACIVRATCRSTWWSASKLRSAGFIALPAAVDNLPQPAAAALTVSWQVQL